MPMIKLHRILLLVLCLTVVVLEGSDAVKAFDWVCYNEKLTPEQKRSLVAADSLVFLKNFFEYLPAMEEKASFGCECDKAFAGGAFYNIMSGRLTALCKQAYGFVWAKGNQAKLALVQLWLEIQHQKLGVSDADFVRGFNSEQAVRILSFKKEAYALGELQKWLKESCESR